MKTGIKLKILSICLLILGTSFTGIDIYKGIHGWYQYENQYGSYWSLADKASTIVQKSKYIDLFVQALENNPFKGEYNAVWLKTPDNSFDKNLEALKSLQQRLREILEMDVQSFQYQTAMQQITEQEQGEAYAMLRVFYGVWWKANYFFLWDWVCVGNVILTLLILVFGISYWNKSQRNY